MIRISASMKNIFNFTDSSHLTKAAAKMGDKKTAVATVTVNQWYAIGVNRELLQSHGGLLDVLVLLI